MISYLELGHVRQLLKTEEWEAVLIDKGSLTTRRLFLEKDDKRYCLHYMRNGITKPHTHKYNVRVRILSGRYRHNLFLNDKKIYSEHMKEGASYHIDNPNLFHQVEIEPQAYCWSLMINDYDFDNPHPSCISAEENNLQTINFSYRQISKHEKEELIKEFKKLI